MSETTKLAESTPAPAPGTTPEAALAADAEGGPEPVPGADSAAEAEAAVEGPRPRLLVLDGHSMAYRAFYALPVENFSTDSGQHTNAVYGFTSMLINLLRDEQPTHVAVAFDLDTPTLRSESYSEYKAGRAKTPSEFAGQVDLIIKVMAAMNIPTITVEGHEADDILATLATRGDEAGYEVLVVSGDRDSFQLINDNVTVLYPRKGVTDLPRLDAAAIEEKYFVTPDRYSDLAALVGESADNLPGVPGVGPKTAAKWINKYGGLEGVLEHLQDIGGKVGDALREHVDSVKRNRQLNRLERDLPLPYALNDLAATRPDRDDVEELFDSLQFKTLRARLIALFGDEDQAAGDEELEVGEHAALGTAAELKAFFEAAAGARTALALLTDPGTVWEDATGIALVHGHTAGFVELGSLDADADAVLAAWLGDQDSPKVIHEFKRAFKALHGRGLPLSGVVDDTSLSAYLIQPDRRSYDLPDLAQYHLRLTVKAAPAAAGQLELALEGEGQRVRDAVHEAAVVLRLSDYFAGQLEERNAASLLTSLELPLSEVLARMELAGIAVSAEKLDRLLGDFTATIDAAQAEAFGLIGHELNLGSPKQLQTVLFDELGMPKTKKIKTGYSTDSDALADLLQKTGHPFLVQLQTYRDATKLRQTVEGLQKSIADDGRIHTTYVQNVAATGRLSSTNPNLQNIPIRSEEGRRIREVFVVGKDSDRSYDTLLTADYSQIEMRIMAHLSGDEALIQAFRDGEDLHRFVGAHIFNVAPEDVTSAMRSKVKAMSYGLVYGLSSFGLSKQLNIPVDEARTLMRDYFERFGAVRDYLRSVVEQARIDGYTSTIEGRRRYLPDLSSDNRQLREMAERMALNAPIQGSAADIIKRAMLGVDAALRAEGLASRMLLQVHDELVLEVAEGERDAVEALVREQMAGAADLSVPLDVSVGIGSSWHEAGH